MHSLVRSFLPRRRTYNIETVSKESTRVEYGKTLAQLGAEYPDIVVLDADLSGSTQTKHFAQVFKDRFFNMGIAEQDLMGTAAGLALGGKIPFASTFAMFATGRAWEQIRQTIAYGNLNVKIVASHGGVTVGEDGGSHQAVEDLALMRILPNLVVLAPADGPETRAMTRWAAAYQGPVYMRTGRMSLPLIYDDSYRFELGRGSVLRDGGDVTLMALGVMVHACLEAADLLAQAGVAARVVNLACLKPLDWELVVACARETGGRGHRRGTHGRRRPGQRRLRSPGRALPGAGQARRPPGHLRHLRQTRPPLAALRSHRRRRRRRGPTGHGQEIALSMKVRP